ncbi:DUF7919 family protein [Microlunatus phosphovorus]|nr:hypothetical protein [Microlunatus phosphovorus]
MTFFSDFSNYRYRATLVPMVNIGWLGAGRSFPTGPVPTDVIEKLMLLTEDLHNIMRGVHDCEFCQEESPIRLAAKVPRGYVSLGMGELHRIDVDETIFTAPSLVIHYIIQHNYQPPENFIRAVREGRPCDGRCGNEE